MSNVYSINLTSSNAHLSSSGDGTIETSTRVSGDTSDQFKIVRGYVGDSKGAHWQRYCLLGSDWEIVKQKGVISTLYWNDFFDHKINSEISINCIIH